MCSNNILIKHIKATYHWHIVRETTGHQQGPIIPQIAKFMGPAWGPPGSCRPQMESCWPHEPCYLGREKFHTIPSTMQREMAGGVMSSHVCTHPNLRSFVTMLTDASLLFQNIEITVLHLALSSTQRIGPWSIMLAYCLLWLCNEASFMQSQ